MLVQPPWSRLYGRDTDGDHAEITLKSAIVALLRPFSGECCFQVIYFVSNIFSSRPCRVSPTTVAETIWSTHAAKNDG
jgi:hypothetical protein